jgi:hypothetical protein
MKKSIVHSAARDPSVEAAFQLTLVLHLNWINSFGEILRRCHKGHVHKSKRPSETAIADREMEFKIIFKVYWPGSSRESETEKNLEFLEIKSRGRVFGGIFTR